MGFGEAAIEHALVRVGDWVDFERAFEALLTGDAGDAAAIEAEAAQAETQAKAAQADAVGLTEALSTRNSEFDQLETALAEAEAQVADQAMATSRVDSERQRLEFAQERAESELMREQKRAAQHHPLGCPCATGEARFSAKIAPGAAHRYALRKRPEGSAVVRVVARSAAFTRDAPILVGGEDLLGLGQRTEGEGSPRGISQPRSSLAPARRGRAGLVGVGYELLELRPNLGIDAPPRRDGRRSHVVEEGVQAARLLLHVAASPVQLPTLFIAPSLTLLMVPKFVTCPQVVGSGQVEVR